MKWKTKSPKGIRTEAATQGLDCFAKSIDIETKEIILQYIRQKQNKLWIMFWICLGILALISLIGYLCYLEGGDWSTTIILVGVFGAMMSIIWGMVALLLIIQKAQVSSLYVKKVLYKGMGKTIIVRTKGFSSTESEEEFPAYTENVGESRTKDKFLFKGELINQSGNDVSEKRKAKLVVDECGETCYLII